MSSSAPMSASASASASSVASRRRARRRNEFRFQLIRCADPNRSVARILELKSQRLGNPNTLFQLKDVLDNAVLTALLDVFQYFAAQGIKWRTLDLSEERNSRYSAELLHQVLQVANESSLFQNMQLTIGHQSNDFSLLPEPTSVSVLQSIEQNTRLMKLSIELSGRQSNEDIQSLLALLKVSKKLKRLEMKCHGFKVEDFSEGFAMNSSLMWLSVKTPANSMTGSSSLRSMMVELARHPSLKLQRLTLSSTADGDLSPPLEALLLSQQDLKMINLHCQPSNAAFAFHDPAPRGFSFFDGFFCRLSSIAPPNSAKFTSRINIPVQPPTRDQVLENFLIEQGPFITIGTELYSTTSDQINNVRTALVNYPRLRLSINPPAEIGYENLVNHCGRYLMFRPDVPLALWPVALERAACLESHKRQRSSIIYELLHGGVFAGRETYASM